MGDRRNEALSEYNRAFLERNKEAIESEIRGLYSLDTKQKNKSLARLAELLSRRSQFYCDFVSSAPKLYDFANFALNWSDPRIRNNPENAEKVVCELFSKMEFVRPDKPGRLNSVGSEKVREYQHRLTAQNRCAHGIVKT